MKFLGILFGSLCLAITSVLFWQLSPSAPPSSTHPSSQAHQETDVGEPDAHAHPGFYEQWFRQKKNKDGIIPHGMYTRWYQHDLRRQKEASMARTTTSTSPVASTQFLGPNDVGGRTRALLYDANDASRIFAGGVSGGLWRSDDNGSSWSSINDAAVNLSVTSITQSPFDDDIYYYGTGEAAGNSAGVAGEGIFKSTNGGVTFSQLSGSASIADLEKIYKVEHDFQSASTVYAGTRNGGCYRTIDAGLSWTQVHATGRVQDIVCFPDGSVLLGIRSDGVYRSPDGSSGSFVKNTDVDLLTSMRRIEMANSADHPYTVYAGFEGASPINGFNGFYKSVDGGINWDPVTVPNCGTGQNSYNVVIGVHPSNPDSLMAGAYKVKISLDGGTTWSNHRNPHADNHAFAMHPTNPDSFLIGNDGGVYALEWATGSPPVRNLNNGYAVTQFYGGGFAATGSVTIGGTQDNGTWKVTDLIEDKCGKNDGGFSHVHQQNPAEAYQSWQGFPSTDGPINLINDFNAVDATAGTRINTDATMNAENYDFISYYEMSYFDSDQLYVRTNAALWRTVNQGTGWTRMTNGTISGIQAVGLSYASDPVAYFGGSSAKFYRFEDAASAAQGTEVNLSSSVPLNVTSDNISSIVVHPKDDGIVYVSFGNNANEPRVYKVTDALTGSPIWTDIAGDPTTTGLPEGLPVNFIQVHPQAPDEIFFAATDFGLYYTADGGVTWDKEDDVPNVAIFQAKMRAEDNALFLFTHGRGIWEVSLLGCTPLAAAPSYFNSLEAPIVDGWSQPTTDDFDWIKLSGSTPSANTGPSSAYDGTYYAYAEASVPNNPGKEALLVSPCFDLSGFNVPKVTWKYHMWGADMGTLWLDISTNAGLSWQGLSIRTGDQGNSWQTGFVNLFGYEGETDVKFRFRAITGTGFRSDIAIDWFWLTDAAPRFAASDPTSLTDDLEAAADAAVAFPNPFSEELQVLLPESVEGEVQLLLYDLQGKLVLQDVVHVNGNRIAVETSTLPRGTYVARLRAGDYSQVLRVVRQ